MLFCVGREEVEGDPLKVWEQGKVQSDAAVGETVLGLDDAVEELPDVVVHVFEVQMPDDDGRDGVGERVDVVQGRRIAQELGGDVGKSRRIETSDSEKAAEGFALRVGIASWQFWK